MLTKAQRDALGEVIKVLQKLLEEDLANYYAPKKKYRRGSPEEVQNMRRNIIADHRNGVSVKNIAEKYNLTVPYIYTIIRKYRKA